jgi:hypothetical protein
MSRRSLTVLTVASVILAAPLAAQDDQAQMKADWERAKRTFLAYVDAMPDSAMTFQPTPGVRTFAQQIEHATLTNYEVAAMTLNGVKAPKAPGDSAKYLHSKAALHAFVAQTFDYLLAALAKATPATLAKTSSVYDQPAATGSRWLQLSYEHATWTLGQTIPYLRMNKVTPPAYEIPF